ncbi:MAG: hypothetical protein R8N23_01040 [Reichenbachiella sp.]|uniref:hypothetical protein n=1 Tax=Reichenbachiella sp. TaxID=2184521 RepID=UPI0029674D1A|nr:hypothetical protein [Reichenbachiella sp.]MDW3208421.1 hypothetical protein [Reichenbachiella sp.]
MLKPIFALLIFLWACEPKEKSTKEEVSESSPVETESIILRFNVNEELAGSAYREKATGYLMVLDGDSTLFFPAFTKSKKEGRVNLILGLHPSLTYHEQMKHLKTILPYASKDYNFDSLSGVFVGRLVQTGDLAIQVTNEYLNDFGGYTSTATSEYDTIASFLAASQLGRDFDQIFAPYDMAVTGTSVEKVFYTELYESIKIDSALHSQWPEKILDAMVWVRIGKKE